MARTTLNLNCVKSCLVDQARPDASQVSTVYTISGNATDQNTKRVILGFESLPQALRYRKLYSAMLYARMKSNIAQDYSTTAYLYLPPDSFNSDFTPSATTWNNSGKYWSKNLGYTSTDNQAYAIKDIPHNASSAFILTSTVPLMISRPLGIEVLRGEANLDLSTVPYIALEYDDSENVPTQIIAKNNKSGYVDPYTAETFEWEYDWDRQDSYYALGPIEQTSFTFSWGTSSTGPWTQITQATSEQSVTIPANTFPAGTIYWKVAGTDGAGQTSETQVYVISTADAQAVANPLYPVSRIIDESSPIEFRWSISNAYGNAATGSDLEYSTDGATWVSLGHVDGTANTFTAPDGTFTAGTYYWRVRSYNTDNVAGPWSATPTFIYLVAPVVENLQATSEPFSTITWQSAEQQAYKIAVDGVSLGTFFGTDKSYTLQDFLEDGEHTVQVAVQNSVSLWSETASYTFTVANVPGDEVTLQGQFAIDAALSWYTESAISNFLVYRDGKKIGSSNSNIFTDRFALGEHSYFVVNVLAGGYYTKSNVVTGVMKACVTVIDTVQNPSGWMELKLTANDPDEQIFSYTRTSILRHFTGAALPVLELSKYEDGSGVYNVAFKDLADANAFEALKGQVVIVKSRGGNVIIGALTQLQKRMGDFFIVFDFTLQRIYWEDFINDQND